MSVSTISKILCSAAGFDYDATRVLPFDQRVRVMSTAGLAVISDVFGSCSAAFALAIAFQTREFFGGVIAVGLGLLLGLVPAFCLRAFNAGRRPKLGSAVSMSDFVGSFPLLIFIHIFAYALSVPLGLSVFRTEIDEGLRTNRRGQQERLNGEIASETADLSRMEARYSQLAARVSESAARLRAAQDQMIKEITGQSGAGMPGAGPSFREVQKVRDERQTELRQDSAELALRGPSLRDSIAMLQKRRNEKAATKVSETRPVEGLVMRIKVMRDVAYFGAWILTLLCLGIMSAPWLASMMFLRPTGERGDATSP